MSRYFKIDRRQFVQAGCMASGSLLLGVTLGCSEDDTASAKEVRLNAYIVIAPDDTVTLINPCAEMGQGVETAVSQILADELGAR
jgi:isoquinoline 1-oxidoreductase beta subunit